MAPAALTKVIFLREMKGSFYRENITTADDASLPGVPVRGPFTLKAQADL